MVADAAAALEVVDVVLLLLVMSGAWVVLVVAVVALVALAVATVEVTVEAVATAALHLTAAEVSMVQDMGAVEEARMAIHLDQPHLPGGRFHHLWHLPGLEVTLSFF